MDPAVEPIPRSLGQRIADARGAKSKAELARAVGVDTKTVYRWEHDKAEPGSSQIDPLARALGVSIIWLLTGEGEGPIELQPTGTDDV